MSFIKASKALTTSLIVISGLAAGAAFATGDTFRNGRSVYGVPVQQPANARVIDVKTAPQALNVRCGDILTFVNGSKSFSWKFEVGGHRPVDLAKIAPADFGAVSQIVYVAVNDYERGG